MQPDVGESPLDYWIRVNKAAEMTEQCLVSKGKSTADLSQQAVIMFIQNCPDKELSLVLKMKPPHEWSAREVQEHLDSHRKVQRFCGTQSTVQRDIAVTLCQSGGVSDTQMGGPSPGCCKVTTDKPSANEDTMARVLSLLEQSLSCNAQLTNSNMPQSWCSSDYGMLVSLLVSISLFN